MDWLAEPADGASHGFGQDTQGKMSQGAETTSASQQGPAGEMEGPMRFLEI